MVHCIQSNLTCWSYCSSFFDQVECLLVVEVYSTENMLLFAVNHMTTSVLKKFAKITSFLLLMAINMLLRLRLKWLMLLLEMLFLGRLELMLLNLSWLFVQPSASTFGKLFATWSKFTRLLGTLKGFLYLRMHALWISLTTKSSLGVLCMLELLRRAIFALRVIKMAISSFTPSAKFAFVFSTSFVTFWFIILRLMILRLLIWNSKWSCLLCLRELIWSETCHFLF